VIFFFNCFIGDDDDHQEKNNLKIGAELWRFFDIFLFHSPPPVDERRADELARNYPTAAPGNVFNIPPPGIF
jgi:hypothetical protein